MKHLKKFNEELVPRFPTSKKGEVLVFLNRGVDISENTVRDIAKKLGYEISGEAYDGGYIIKTVPGQEEQAGSDFVDNYPEFFGSYEREDAKDDYLYNELDLMVYNLVL
jgi:hypothetical protein